MSDLASGVNNKVLKWARERSAHSVDEVAKALNKDVDVIESWESGDSVPTYIQLEKLAYQLYKRPIALFFFPNPPEERDPKESFRTLPDFEVDNLSANTRYEIRRAEAMQITLKELNDDKNPAERKIFRDIKANIWMNVADLAKEVRKYLPIELWQQIDWKSSEDALQNWRERVEDVGVFVFKRSLEQRDISGFSLSGEEFPVIYLNNSTTPTRQIFTLFHELSHVLLQINGITKRDDRYIRYLKGNDKRTEVFCNAFAAEFLVPSQDFDWNLTRQTLDEEVISALADHYKVSREVILRKLLDRRLIDQEYYEKQAEEWIKAYEKGRKPDRGGNYYATQATYLGDRFLKLAFGRYYQGRCTVEQLADYLNVRVNSVAGLEHYMWGKALSQ